MWSRVPGRGARPHGGDRDFGFTPWSCCRSAHPAPVVLLPSSREGLGSPAPGPPLPGHQSQNHLFLEDWTVDAVPGATLLGQAGWSSDSKIPLLTATHKAPALRPCLIETERPQHGGCPSLSRTHKCSEDPTPDLFSPRC